MSIPEMNGRSRENEPRHPIGVVSTRTGLTTSALRAWERRYGVVAPGRSGGGQRLYTDRDIELLSLLKRVTDAGRSIGDVASLDVEEVRSLAREDEQAREAVARARRQPTAPAVGDMSTRIRERAWDAVERLDGDGLEGVLRRGAAALGGVPFMEEVVAPLLRDVGQSWVEGRLRPANEHVATGVVRRVLTWLADASGADDGPPIAIGTLPGERHELGALLAATTASLEGWSVTYLGPDLPVEELAAAAEAIGALAVGVSVANPPNGDITAEDLRELRRRLRPDVLILVGGGQAASMVQRVGDPGVRLVKSLVALRTALREARLQLLP
jgi:DNA-binding transcriptional MerR regulator/methylmalonyl-CoA mutase cobalamin-binding subunit